MKTYAKTHSPQQQGPTKQPPTTSSRQAHTSRDTAQLQRQAQANAQTRVNRTGMSDGLLTRLEAASGFDMHDVRVHRNSPKPAQLNAHAYAQGTNIYLGPGQERHLPHEAWHVVQQKQGRVRAMRQFRGVGLNDDVGLEREANGWRERTKVTSGQQRNQIPKDVVQLARKPKRKAKTKPIRKNKHNTEATRLGITPVDAHQQSIRTKRLVSHYLSRYIEEAGELRTVVTNDLQKITANDMLQRGPGLTRWSRKVYMGIQPFQEEYYILSEEARRMKAEYQIDDHTRIRGYGILGKKDKENPDGEIHIWEGSQEAGRMAARALEVKTVNHERSDSVGFQIGAALKQLEKRIKPAGNHPLTQYTSWVGVVSITDKDNPWPLTPTEDDKYTAGNREGLDLERIGEEKIKEKVEAQEGFSETWKGYPLAMKVTRAKSAQREERHEGSDRISYEWNWGKELTTKEEQMIEEEI